MLNRVSIVSHFVFGSAVTIAIFAANPVLSHKAGITFDRLIFVFIELLYRLKDLA